MHGEESKSGGGQPRLVKQITVAFSVWFTLTGVALAEQYLCVVDKAVGFSYDKVTKEWNNTNFNANSKYLISEGDGSLKDAVWQITEVGNSFPSIGCKRDFNDYGILLCSDLISDFRFNKRNGRFLHTYPIGYYNVLPGEDEGTDTPSLEIGKCSPF